MSMQANIAVGLMELSSIAKGVETLDTMCKAAGVEPLISQPVSKGKYLIVISGPVGEVESAMYKGGETAGSFTVSKFIIRNIHNGVLAALNKKVSPQNVEAVGMIETKEALPALFAADAAAKAAYVQVTEVRTASGIGGKGYFTITGDPGAVRTALSAGTKAIGEDAVVSRMYLPNAHEYLKNII